MKIEIVCMLANFDDINPVLADLVMEAGYQAIDFLFDQVILSCVTHCDKNTYLCKYLPLLNSLNTRKVLNLRTWLLMSQIKLECY